MPFVTAEDVAQLHSAVNDEYQGLNAAMVTAIASQQVPAMGEPLASWTKLGARVIKYLGDEPSTFRAAAQMDQGQQLQREMQPWHSRIPGAPAAPPAPPKQQDLLGNLSDVVKLVLLVMVAREVFRR